MRLTTAVAATAAAGALAATITGLASSAQAAPTTLTAYGRAQHDWIVGAKVSAAMTNKYWNGAAHDLAVYGNKYYVEHQDLVALEGIPETDTTAKQQALAARLTRDLNGFFHTPNLYGVKQGNSYAYAKSDWITSTKVSSADSGVWLEGAADELYADGHKYDSQIGYLISLKSIPETSTTAHQRAVAKKDIAELDAFFNTPGLDQ